VRLTECTVRINKCKNVISWDQYSMYLLLHLVINGENYAMHILKHDRLPFDKANDKDIVQKGCLAFKELYVLQPLIQAL
jgi:hypothetical protein